MPDETGLAPAAEEALGTQESALDCAGASVTSLNMGAVSSWGGVLATGGGTWSVAYPANGIILEYYVDNVLRGTQPILGDSNRSGTWTFNDSPIACGAHNLEVRGYPAIFDSATPAPGRCTTGSLSRTSSFSQGCPTATLTCSQSGSTINCTGSGSGGEGGPYISYWREGVQTDWGMNYTDWEQGSNTYGLFCIPATTRDNFYRQFIYYKVKDASGMESPVRSYTRLCVP
ncbi:hypothetical protein BO221_14585 [Archangium sp. Cb G35]|uniref:hypothetical protein n=1 Tax=Archangium sp. Cb G35 TaxID=1920190 RepID=UPI0009689737|nr:hypothetical protein [Archangium sp. Cb G35]OJT24386.1 hypothetical protein BO221_14585 [Archangium sp. Cb G35]